MRSRSNLKSHYEAINLVNNRKIYAAEIFNHANTCFNIYIDIDFPNGNFYFYFFIFAKENPVELHLHNVTKSSV